MLTFFNTFSFISNQNQIQLLRDFLDICDFTAKCISKKSNFSKKCAKLCAVIYQRYRQECFKSKKINFLYTFIIQVTKELNKYVVLPIAILVKIPMKALPMISNG